METLELNGKTYIKASSAARETGYTMDYIGQLCRKKKIDAQLVGRTWYVNEREIHSHRRTRGRHTVAKVRESVKQEIATKSTPTPRTSPSPAFAHHLLEHEVTYHTDDSEIIPSLKSRHVTIESHDTEVSVVTDHEKELSVQSEQENTKLKPTRTEEPEVKWNGTIVVSPLEEEDVVTEANESKEALHISPDHEHRVTHKVKLHVNAPNKTPVSEVVTTKVVEEDDAADTSIAITTASPEDTAKPLPSRVPRPHSSSFTERLNHAHVLNQMHDSEGEGLHETARTRHNTETTGTKVDTPITSRRGVVSTILSTTAMTVTVLLLVFSGANLFLEDAVYTDAAGGQSTGSTYRSSIEYHLKSLNLLKDGAANIISSIRDIAK